LFFLKKIYARINNCANGLINKKKKGKPSDEILSYFQKFKKFNFSFSHKIGTGIEFLHAKASVLDFVFRQRRKNYGICFAKFWCDLHNGVG
jgi:hypothetical protein